MDLLKFSKLFVLNEEDNIKIRIITFSVEDGNYKVNTADGQDYAAYLRSLGSKGNVGEVVLTPKNREVLVFTGIGSAKEECIKRRNVMTAGAAAIKKVSNIEGGYIVFDVECRDLILGAVLGTYKYSFLKSKDTCTSYKFKVTSEDGKKAIAVGNAQNFARFLGDTPANHCYPMRFVEYATEYLKTREKVEIAVHSKGELVEKNMNLIISVGQGAESDTMLFKAMYRGASHEGVDLTLVGKGVTFDSGGISLKPPKNMFAMKGDMLGGASVVSVMGLIDMDLPLNVEVIVPLVENMPSGRATKPGDVFMGMNGKTVEVLNTDAEGRLILADALTFAQESKPKYIIDVATLTGAMGVTLGDAYIGYFCNSNEFAEIIDQSSVSSNDLLWRMPLSQLYSSQIKSQIADIKNIGGPKAGSATAALFLNEFIEDGTKWAHFDIAGVMDEHSNSDLFGKGMTGIGVHAIYVIACNLSNK